MPSRSRYSLASVLATVWLLVSGHGDVELLAPPIDAAKQPPISFTICPDFLTLGGCRTPLPGELDGYCRQPQVDQCLATYSSPDDRFACLRSTLGLDLPPLEPSMLSFCAPPAKIGQGCGCRRMPYVAQIFGEDFETLAKCEKDVDDQVSKDAEGYDRLCKIKFQCINPTCPNQRSFYPVNDCGCFRNPNPKDPTKPFTWNCAFNQPMTCCCLQDI